MAKLRAELEFVPLPFVSTKGLESFHRLLDRTDRHFAAEAELQLAVIEFARKAGFTIAEIKLLFHGFRKSAPASARWRQLAQKKYHEMDAQIARLKDMQKLLKKCISCHCTNLDDCGRLLSHHENR